jgi:spore maturation protein CgeB
MIERAKKVLGNQLSVHTTFDANVVNTIYNEHHVVLNLGLYFSELGSPEYLSSYAFQQRVFEAIGAGTPCLTHRPADIAGTPNQQYMFKEGEHILYYDNDSFDSILRHLNANPTYLNPIRENVLKIREQHTYKARMETLIKHVRRLLWP